LAQDTANLLRMYVLFSAALPTFLAGWVESSHSMQLYLSLVCGGAWHDRFSHLGAPKQRGQEMFDLVYIMGHLRKYLVWCAIKRGTL